MSRFESLGVSLASSKRDFMVSLVRVGVYGNMVFYDYGNGAFRECWVFAALDFHTVLELLGIVVNWHESKWVF